MTHAHDDAITDPEEFWETRYLNRRGESGRMWSGRVNATIAHQVADVTPGTALELGSGEGADALWLAAEGWTVTAVDISGRALAVGAAEAERQGLADRIEWVQADLATWQPPAEYDLVTSAFLHSPVELPREAILRRAAAAVAPGGRLLVVGHGAFPPGSHPEHDVEDAPPLPTPDEVLAALELPRGWEVETNALVDRVAKWRDGTDVTLTDSVLRVRRVR
ncbi:MULTISPECIES: cyclopropane-fatty-acyl-phospholipid synthase family protein [unclassified Microbacterium]|uniref:SAM-dependent methyltransferase n=1 Tax=unclassified Microbacterium TaxID=2609290 RepID=UPI000EA9A15E|nr:MULTISPECIES: class I SAM-dependent methyltransferase [unclassified Microbacterium]MBT2483487.1 class I SAM-dependent methyltransferase [Microbacterium sp. ISL-108]RKN66505.1 class I SAM-dependent methyltransferase [Microbacterium sp. CGR2]